jgi:hypothetical protein
LSPARSPRLRSDPAARDPAASADPARRRLRALGQAYLRFAAGEPGLFRLTLRQQVTEHMLDTIIRGL